MAIGLKQWIGIVSVGCVLMAVAALPPRTLDDDPRPLPPAQARYSEVLRDVRRVAGAVAGRVWVDSLSAVAVADAREGLALGVPEGRWMAEEDLDEWRQRLNGQLDTLSRRADGVVLGFYHVVSSAEVPPASRTFAGTLDDTTYCLQVAPTRSLVEAGSRRAWRSELGVCRLYAKYGMAGSRVQQWLRAGNAWAGAYSRPGRDPGNRRDWGRLSELPAPVFGMNRVFASFGSAPLALQRCVAGHTDACRDVLLENAAFRAARSAGNAEELAMAPEEELLTWSAISPYLLSDLEGQFGEDAFLRFWTSEEPVDAAFEAAFGLGAGEWTLGWVDAEMGLDEAGPGLMPGTVLSTLAALMVLGAAVSLTQTRRRLA